MHFYLDDDETPPEKKFRRVERKINHKGWQFLHNLIAHPMLAIYRPWGVKLHEYTAKKMYGNDSEEYSTVDPNDVNG